MAKLQALRDYYEEGDSEEVKELVKEFYQNVDKGKFNIEKYVNIGKLMGFFDKWGSLCVYGYLPIWVFEGNPGYLVISFYKYTKEYIYYRRGKDNPNTPNIKNQGYAINIEKLAYKINKKYKYNMEL